MTLVDVSCDVPLAIAITDAVAVTLGATASVALAVSNSEIGRLGEGETESVVATVLELESTIATVDDTGLSAGDCDMDGETGTVKVVSGEALSNNAVLGETSDDCSAEDVGLTGDSDACGDSDAVNDALSGEEDDGCATVAVVATLSLADTGNDSEGVTAGVSVTEGGRDTVDDSDSSTGGDWVSDGVGASVELVDCKVDIDSVTDGCEDAAGDRGTVELAVMISVTEGA